MDTTERLRQAGSDHRDRMARRSREQTDSVADIGDLPPVIDAERKERCRFDLFAFLTEYFPNSTGLKPFSDDHRKVIARIERCILHGGRYVNAVYRGFAKTTISENAALWAVLYGHRRFVPIFGADAPAGVGNIDSIKRELEGNDLLLEDFPEVCFPIRALEGKSQRQHSQCYRGELTHIRWTADTIVMPEIPGSDAAGGILSAHGLTGSHRGMKHKRPDGIQQRPDFVIIDDPQTDESAESPVQVAKRLGVIRKTILKLGGHNKALAVVLNATVIAPDDVVDQLLDPRRNTAWQSERIKMVRSWASAHAHEVLWLKQYADIRNTYDKHDPASQREAHHAATAFYEANRQAMDEGVEVSWRYCYDEETEVSAIQHAYNALIDDGPEVFASECQNEPLPQVNGSTMLSVEEIVRRVNGYRRGQVPQDATHLTGFIDVHKDAFFWIVAAWADSFTGYVVDYGTYPDQKRDRFSLRDVRYTLAKAHPGTGLEGWIFAGLKELAFRLFTAKRLRDDSAEMSLERVLIDANWGDSTETVKRFCRQTEYAAQVKPSHGMFIKVGTVLNDRKQKPGERRGLNWREPPLAAGSPARHLIFDANFWKSFCHKRLSTSPGDPGSLTLFEYEANGRKADHGMIAEHLTSESPMTVQANGRTAEEWTLRPNRENHWLDCLVGSAVGASTIGVALPEHRGRERKTTTRHRPRVSALF